MEDICFIDLQLSRYGSPALDILYHLFSSTRKSLRDRCYDDLLTIYHTSLSDIVRRLGCDPDKLFCFTDLQAELRKYGAFAVIMGLQLVPVVHFKPHEFVDMAVYADNLLSDRKANMFCSDGRNNVSFVEAINEMFTDIVNYGYDY